MSLWAQTLGQLVHLLTVAYERCPLFIMYINDGMCSTTDPLAVTWAAFIFFSIHERLHSASLLFLTDVCGTW